MDLKFTIVNGFVLRATKLAPAEKIVFSVIRNFCKNGQKFFGKPDWLAEQLGLETTDVLKILMVLQKKNLIIGDENGYKLAIEENELEDFFKKFY